MTHIVTALEKTVAEIVKVSKFDSFNTRGLKMTSSSMSEATTPDTPGKASIPQW